MKPDHAKIIDVTAAVRHGVTTRPDLLSRGMTTSQVDGLVRAGVLASVARGVYRARGSPPSWFQRLQVAVIVAGPTAVVSHRSAAFLLGLDGFPEPSLVDITLAARRHVLLSHTSVHRTRDLPRIDRVRVDGFPVTSAARTVIDLAALGATATELGQAIDSAARLGLATGDFVARRIDALGRRGRRGVGMLDAVMLDAGGHSYLERRFLELLRSGGLPRPRTQVVHRSGGGSAARAGSSGATVARVDFEWSAERLIAEVNGRRGHSGDQERAKDARRRNALQAEGFRVIEFTTSQVLDEPDYVRATVARHLAPAT